MVDWLDWMGLDKNGGGGGRILGSGVGWRNCVGGLKVGKGEGRWWGGRGKFFFACDDASPIAKALLYLCPNFSSIFIHYAVRMVTGTTVRVLAAEIQKGFNPLAPHSFSEPLSGISTSRTSSSKD